MRNYLIPAKEIIRDERGFILPLSVLLVITLSVSGAGFFQFDYQERRMVQNETANHAAFYLANAGIERGRSAFNIVTASGQASWTPILDPAHPDHPAEYPTDASPDPRLCPFAETRGCVIPPFQAAAASAFIAADGDAVTSPDLPFDGAFDDGFYTVRAYNNLEGGAASLVDNDQILTVRALGSVRGQEKILEVDIAATTSMKLINCVGEPGDPCPGKMNDNMTLQHMEGRGPSSSPYLPSWSTSFYKSADNLPCSIPVIVEGNTTLVAGAPDKEGEVQLQSNRCYFSSGNVTVKNAGAGFTNIVIYSEQDLVVSGGATFANTILIGGTDVQLQGNITTQAPGVYPAVISGGSITKGDASVAIYGNIYAVGNIGSETHPWNPNQVHGSILGHDVYLKAAATMVTDDDNPAYYAFMPGFNYPDELKSTQSLTGSWREIQ